MEIASNRLSLVIVLFVLWLKDRWNNATSDRQMLLSGRIIAPLAIMGARYVA